MLEPSTYLQFAYNLAQASGPEPRLIPPLEGGKSLGSNSKAPLVRIIPPPTGQGYYLEILLFGDAVIVL